MDSIHGLSEGIKSQVLRNLYKNICSQDSNFSHTDCSLSSSSIIEKLKECNFTPKGSRNPGIYGRILTTDDPIKSYTSDFCETSCDSSSSNAPVSSRSQKESIPEGIEVKMPKSPMEMEQQSDEVSSSSFKKPLTSLSVSLIQTYININNLYYDKVKKTRAVEAKKNSQRPVSSGYVNINNASDLNLSNSSAVTNSRELISPEFKANAILLDRYQIIKLIGGGTFGQVFKARDLLMKQDVAIKVIKNKRCFIRQAQEEIRILQKIKSFQNHENPLIRSQASYFVNFHGAFAAHNHLCIVLELLADNLFDLLHNTNYRGVSLGLTRKFARQLCECLAFLAKPEIGIIHCDLKPENILMVNTKRSAIKVIDFGSSCRVNSKPYHYIQSRFYRSPEVILGLSYGQEIDIWSLGCVIVELHTGDPLFPGQNELDQLLKIIEVLGFPPIEMIEKSPKLDCFFDKIKLPRSISEIPTNTIMGTCLSDDGSPLAYRPKTIWTQNGQQMKSEFSGALSKPLKKMIGTETAGSKGQHTDKHGHTPKDYQPFLELIEKVLVYRPEKRLKPLHALCQSYFAQQPSSQPQNQGSNSKKSDNEKSDKSDCGDASKEIPTANSSSC